MLCHHEHFLVADIYEKVSEELEKSGHLDCECIGGGRIRHDSQAKKIHVYGYSMVRESCWLKPDNVDDNYIWHKSVSWTRLKTLYFCKLGWWLITLSLWATPFTLSVNSVLNIHYFEFSNWLFCNSNGTLMLYFHYRDLDEQTTQ